MVMPSFLIHFLWVRDVCNRWFVSVVNGLAFGRDIYTHLRAGAKRGLEAVWGGEFGGVNDFARKQKPPQSLRPQGSFIGTPDWIRTSDPQSRSRGKDVSSRAVNYHRKLLETLCFQRSRGRFR